jgi:hypothetical protein
VVQTRTGWPEERRARVATRNGQHHRVHQVLNEGARQNDANIAAPVLTALLVGVPALFFPFIECGPFCRGGRPLLQILDLTRFGAGHGHVFAF